MAAVLPSDKEMSERTTQAIESVMGGRKYSTMKREVFVDTLLALLSGGYAIPQTMLKKVMAKKAIAGTLKAVSGKPGRKAAAQYAKEIRRAPQKALDAIKEFEVKPPQYNPKGRRLAGAFDWRSRGMELYPDVQDVLKPGTLPEVFWHELGHGGQAALGRGKKSLVGRVFEQREMFKKNFPEYLYDIDPLERSAKGLAKQIAPGKGPVRPETFDEMLDIQLRNALRKGEAIREGVTKEGYDILPWLVAKGG